MPRCESYSLHDVLSRRCQLPWKVIIILLSSLLQPGLFHAWLVFHPAKWCDRLMKLPALLWVKPKTNHYACPIRVIIRISTGPGDYRVAKWLLWGLNENIEVFCLGESNHWKCQTQPVSGNVNAILHIGVFAQTLLLVWDSYMLIWNCRTRVQTSCITSVCVFFNKNGYSLLANGGNIKCPKLNCTFIKLNPNVTSEVFKFNQQWHMVIQNDSGSCFSKRWVEKVKSAATLNGYKCHVQHNLHILISCNG